MKVGGQELLRTLVPPYSRTTYIQILFSASMYPQQQQQPLWVHFLWYGILVVSVGALFWAEENPRVSRHHGHGRPMPVAPRLLVYYYYSSSCTYVEWLPFFSSLTRFYTRLISILGKFFYFFFAYGYQKFFLFVYIKSFLAKIIYLFKFEIQVLAILYANC